MDHKDVCPECGHVHLGIAICDKVWRRKPDYSQRGRTVPAIHPLSPRNYTTRIAEGFRMMRGEGS